MYRTDAADNVNPKPVRAAVGTVGFYTDGPPGTEVDADHMNAIMDELALTIEDGGETLDKADDNQLSAALGGAFATRSSATDTGSVSSHRTRLVASSTTSQASGANSACMSSQGSSTAAARSAVIASNNATIDASAGDSCIIATSANCDIGSNAERSALIACNGVDVGVGAGAFNSLGAACLNVEIDANRAAVIASSGTTAGGDDVDLEGANCAIIACTGTAADPTRIESTTTESLIAASKNVEIDDGENNAIIASEDVTINSTGAGNGHSAIIASAKGSISGGLDGAVIIASGGTNTPTITGGGLNAIIAGQGEQTVSGIASALLACQEGTGDGPAVSANGSACIGVSGGVTNDQVNFVILGSTFDATRFSIAAANANEAGIGGGEASALEWRIQSEGVDAGKGFFNGGTQASGADYAELFENVERGILEPGLLLTRRGREVQPATLGDRIVGVVSTRPAMLANGPLNPSPGDPNDAKPERWTKVALLGQLLVKVDATVEPDSIVVPSAARGIGAHHLVNERQPRGRPVECMEIVEPYDAERGYALALCLVG